MNNICLLIPIYNRIEITKQGIGSLDRAIQYHRENGNPGSVFTIMVIDDGSTDGSGDWIRENRPDITVLTGDGNLWWSGAINKGLECVLEKGIFSHVMFWNDDTECELTYFSNLSHYLADPAYHSTVIASKILWLDKPDTIFNYGCTFDFKSGQTKIIAFNQKDGIEYSTPIQIEWTGGMGTTIPIEVIKKVGLLDDRNFPQYHGDKDYFLRVVKSGSTIIAMPDLRIWNNRLSTGPSLVPPYTRSFIRCLTRPNSQYNFRKNLVFVRKHTPGARAYYNLITNFSRFFFSYVKKALRLNMVKDFALSVRLVMFNHLINRIPFSAIRIPLMRLYMRIGHHTNVMPGVIIYNKELNRDQIQIGHHCVINRECLLDGRKGRIILGNNVDIARGTWIFTLEHDVHSDEHAFTSGDVVIEDYAWIASRVIILPGVTIGKGVVVAAGAVVTKSIETMKIAGGVPAKVIGVRRSNLKYELNHFPFFGY